MFEGLKRSAGPPTRDDWNRLLEHLESLPVTPGPGLLMRRTPAGTTLWPRKRRGGGTGEDAIAFKVYGVRLDGSAYKCKVRPGWVRTINPDASASDTVKDWMPVDGSDVPLDATAADEPAGPPEFTIANGQTIYCRVKTTAKGIIEEAPKIEVADTPEAGEHFQPPDADVEGDLYFPIANVEISGDPAVVSIEQIQQGGPIVVVPNLPEHKNIGGGQEVASGRTPEGDTYDFRTLKSVDGTGEPVLNEQGEGGAGEAIIFTKVKQRDEDSGSGYPQIKVVGVGDAPNKRIEIQGNGVELNASFYRLTSITVRDGLVLSVGGAAEDDEGEGWWGQVGFQFSPAVGSFVTMTLDFEAGRLVNVTNSIGVVGAGTEADPGFSNFLTGDTDT